MAVERKKPEDRHSSWRPSKSVQLFYDEIDTIIAIMRKIGDVVSVETLDFSGTVNSAQDLAVISTKRLQKCTFHAGTAERELWVWIDTPIAVTISPSDDILLAGASTQVQSIMTRAQRTLGGINFGDAVQTPWTSTAFFMALCFALFGAFLVIFGPHIGTHTKAHGLQYAFGPLLLIFFGIVLLAVIVVFITALVRHNPKPSGSIVMAYRKDAPSWWDRNRTAVGISLVTNVVVAMLSFLAGRSF